MPGPAPSLVLNYLEPADILAEVLFGLIMVLTITLGARLAMGEEGGARELLIAALGCNLAWGIIDGAMYVMNAMFNRGRTARIFTELKRSGESGALAIDRAGARPEVGRPHDGRGTRGGCIDRCSPSPGGRRRGARTSIATMSMAARCARRWSS